VLYQIAGLTGLRRIPRHFDPETAAYLFPHGTGAVLEAQRQVWVRRHRGRKLFEAIRARSAAREAIWNRPDVAALRTAYQFTAPTTLDGFTVRAGNADPENSEQQRGGGRWVGDSANWLTMARLGTIFDGFHGLRVRSPLGSTCRFDHQ